MAPVLSATGVVAGYGGADEILKGVDFSIAPGEIACIVGPNGAGKSTLLKTIAGLLIPKHGTVSLVGDDITGQLPRDIARRGLAYVPQEHNIFATLTVRENLEIGSYLETEGIEARIAQAFARFPVLGSKRRHAARTLSGGERQMLAMAMAMVVEPRVLLLDEPSLGLAPQLVEQLYADLARLRDDGFTILLVDQMANLAHGVADRAYVLRTGAIVHHGSAAELRHDDALLRAYLGDDSSNMHKETVT
jgi:branched-chain amino acid transport system ATP-binding protein/neutral amino acid transport system ATP-binding protein